jgi:hypothetical protein
VVGLERDDRCAQVASGVEWPSIVAVR